jgi:hypothetical protein
LYGGIVNRFLSLRGMHGPIALKKEIMLLDTVIDPHKVEVIRKFWGRLDYQIE